MTAGYAKRGVTVRVIVGDITDFCGDCIVNPANPMMVMGGGVAGAIKRRGGPEIEEEARRYAPVPIGKAVVTSAGKLRCKYVVHSPTVETPGGRSRPEWVFEATRAALEAVREKSARSIAFPLMGAGVGGLSPEESVRSMLRAIESVGGSMEISIYTTDPATAGILRDILEKDGWMRKEL